ncbi:MAG TPA: hypothetical protein VFI54_12605 [Solirubrobacteraceae bacterium]|nr:hypothetical protein [Solirubrobacteraceae bacterium]
MVDGSQAMIAFLGVPADQRLLNEDVSNLPEAEQRREPEIATEKHDRLVAAGSLLTGVSLIGGAAMALYGGWQVLLNGGGALDAIVAVIGILLVATHWGWVHVAEYVGLTIDERQQRVNDDRTRAWLSEIQPYPRFSVSTSVLDDASTRVERVLHQPVLTAQHTFTFVRETDAEKTYAAHASAVDIATTVETMRRQARIDTDRLRELWEAASTSYTAALNSADDEQQRLAARRAAATALSEHINASLLEPPLVE